MIPDSPESRADYAAWSYSVEPVPFDAFRAELLKLYEPPLRSRNTLKMMRRVLRLAAELLGPGATTEALTPEFVARFIASRPAATSNNTTLGLLSYLRSACSYAQQRGYLRVSPFLIRRKWLRPEKSRKPRQHYPAEAIARVIERARSEIERKGAHRQAGPGAVWRARRVHALIATVAYTGMRRNEALYLRPEDIDLEAGILTVVSRPENNLKTTGSERLIPIAPPLAEVLRDWLPRLSVPAHGFRFSYVFPNTADKPWTGGTTARKPLSRLKAIGRRAGLPDLNFLGLRHSFATLARELWGWTPSQIAAVLGHTNTRTQEHYVHQDVPALRELAKRITFAPPPPPESPAP